MFDQPRLITTGSRLLRACASGLGAVLIALMVSGSAFATDHAKELVATFDKAFADGDSTEKRAAMKGLNTLGKEHDDTVFPLLIKAIGDRQTHDEAVDCLRARTGLAPTINNRGTGYPGYPNSDEPSDWNAWLALRKKDKDEQKKLADQDKKLKELEDKEKKKKDGKEGDPKSGDEKGGDAQPKGDEQPAGDEQAGTKKPKSSAVEPPSDLGRPDRIIFKSGGSLVCYIISKRTNTDGVLQSVRIAHLDDGGEETLAADLIARIEEDIR